MYKSQDGAMFETGETGLFPTEGVSISSQKSGSSCSDSPSMPSLLAESPTRPSWLFSAQTQPLYNPTEALSSLLNPFSSPAAAESQLANQLSNSPYQHMTNCLAVSSGRQFELAGDANSLAAQTQINGMTMQQQQIQQQQQMMSAGNGAVPPPKNPKLYKTELCRSWMDHGRCNYGERCQYAHGEAEKRPIPRHPKYKTEACQSFHQTGYCPYGHRCHFIHNETEIVNQSQPSISLLQSPYSQTQPRSTALPLGGQVAHVSGNSSLLSRLSSVPGYGSSGESNSSLDSGSESPNGSFSPGLDADESGPFTIGGFVAPVTTGRRNSSQQKRLSSQAFNVYQDNSLSDLMNDLLSLNSEISSKWENGNVSSTCQASSQPTSNVIPKVKHLTHYGVRGYWRKPTHSSYKASSPGRLPVFAQLSNPQ